MKMDEIIEKLLVPDNNSIVQGTHELREAFKNPDIVPMLCTAIGTSASPDVRQYSAILLRKKLMKYNQWSKLPVNTRQNIKQGLIQALINEQEKFVKTSIGQVIGTLVKHEFPSQTWPELMQWLQQMATSQSNDEKELGFFTLQILTDIAPDQFLKHNQNFAMLFLSTINSLTDPSSVLAYMTLETMANFTTSIEGDKNMINAYNAMIPKVVVILKALAKKRPDRALKSFTLLDSLIENAVVVIVPHIKLIIELCLELASDNSLETDVQIKALSVIGDLVVSKKKAIVKKNLIEPILGVLFGLMTYAPKEEDSEEYFAEDSDSNTPVTCANQTLDVMALHLPPEKLMPPLLEYIQPGLQNNNLYIKKASYLAMAVVSEGCSDYIRNHHLKEFLEVVCVGINDPASVVANAALFCLGQFSEYLQPEISEYAEKLLPVLLQHLEKLVGKTGEPPGGVDRMFYALEMFCENLDEALLDYLPPLMEHLFPLMLPPHAVRLRELAISAVGACGNAAKEKMIPYFGKIMESLKQYLTEHQEEDTMCLQIQAIDTLGVFARTIGEKEFRSIAQETLTLGLHLMQSNDDPDLRKAVYGLFASVSIVLKEDMAPMLPTIIEPIINSVKSGQGMVYHYKESEALSLPVNLNISDEEEEEDIGQESDVSDDEEDVEGYTVENAFLEEKEEAVLALKELAEHTRAAFWPFLEQCCVEVFKILNYPHEDVRKAAITAMVQFCLNMHIPVTYVNGGKAALTKALNVFIPKCSEIIRMDADRAVVMAALDGVSELLKNLGPLVLEGDGHKDAILNCIKDVLNRRTECQDEGDEDETEAEHDEMLIESAGEVVPNLGNAMPIEQFAEHYTQILPMFVNLTKNQCSESQRSFGVGMIAECMSVIGPYMHMFVEQLLPLLFSWTQDSSSEVRNNSIYALGELAFYGKESVFPVYMDILEALSRVVASETNPGVLDNICGAIARLMVTNAKGVPLEHVVPVFVKCLPLREDFEENKWIFRCLNHLYQMGSKVLAAHIVPIISASALCLHHNHIEPEFHDLIINLIQMCHRDFPSECVTAAQSLPEDVMHTLQRICLSS